MCSRHLISIWLNCWAPQNDSTPLDVPQSWSWGQRSPSWGWSSGAWARLVGYGRHTPSASCDNPPAVGRNRGLDVGEKEKGIINHLILFWWLEDVRVRASESEGGRNFREQARIQGQSQPHQCCLLHRISYCYTVTVSASRSPSLSDTQGGGPYSITAQQSVACYVEWGFCDIAYQF
jgi:hypothetical protein